MKMEHCGRCGHTWGHHAGLARCPKCGWNATQSTVRHPTRTYEPNGHMTAGHRVGRTVIDDENLVTFRSREGGMPRELDFGD